MVLCSTFDTIEASIRQPRRSWTTADKLRIVAETYEPGVSVGHVARCYGIAHRLLRRWRRLANSGMLVAEANRRCAFCNEPFSHSRSDARFCSSKCRQKAYRAHKLSLVECS